MRWMMLAMLLMAGPARADQTDPRLDTLFAQLRAAPSAAAARPIEFAIVGIWFASGAPAIDSLMQLGEQALARGDLAGAIVVFDAVIRQRPTYAEGWNRRATAFYMLGAHDRAEADVNQTLELEPRHFGALAGLGLIAAARGQEDRALAAFERALAVNPHLLEIRTRVDALRRRSRDRGI